MKSNFFLLIFSIFIISCSSDDSNSSDENPVVGNYFPSNINDSWNYNITNTSTTNPELNFTAQDNVEVISSTTSNFTLEINNGTTPAYGTINSILSSGTLTKSDSTLEFDGTISLPIISEFDGIAGSDIELTDFLVYNCNAAINSELASVSNSISQDVDFEGIVVPIIISYTIINTKKTDLSSLTVNGKTFNDIISTEITLNMSINITLASLGSQALLQPQDVLIITNYYANGVGLVKSEANQSFSLNQNLIGLLELADLTIDYQTTGSVNNVQEIENYSVSSN